MLARHREREIVVEWRRVEAAGAEDVVRANQGEMLLLAYLLTGSPDAARGLTRDAFLRALRELPANDPEVEWRSAVLSRLCGCYLQQGYEPLTTEQGVTHPALDVLGRLSRLQRLALVLSDVSGVGLPALNRLLASDGIPVPVDVESIRQRLEFPGGESMRSELLAASIGRPRDDLWPSVEPVLAADRLQRQRRNRFRGLAVLASIVLVAFVSVAAMLVDYLPHDGQDSPVSTAPAEAPVAADTLTLPDYEPATPTPYVPATPAGNVPGALHAVVHHYAPDGTNSHVTLDRFDSNELQVEPSGNQLDGSLHYSTLISPDGGRLVLIHGEWTDRQVSYSVTVVDSATMATQWSVDVGTFEQSPTTGRNTMRVAPAVTADSVYLALIDDEALESISIDAFDLRTGTFRDRLRIQLDMGLEEDDALDLWTNASMRVIPDESQMYLMLDIWSSSYDWRERQVLGFAIDLPKLELSDPEAQPISLSDGDREVYWQDMAMAPGGAVLHGYTLPGDNKPARYLFLDLETDHVIELELPFDLRQGQNRIGLARIPSNDGQRVYLIDTGTGEVAVINLLQQKLERHFRIDTGAFGSRFGDGRGRLQFSGACALTHDGTRLYIAAYNSEQVMQGDADHSTGIWVVDLYTWTIVDFIPIRGGVSELKILPGSNDLLVWNWYYADAGDQESTWSIMRVSFDDQQGVASVAAEVQEPSNNWSLLALPDIYRSQYGRTPAVDGVEPADIDNYTMLPLFEATLSDGAASGVSTTLDVQVVHPVSGETMQMWGGGVRFNPDSTVMARLRADGQPGRIVMLSNVETGIYRGGVTLPADGAWSIDVLLTEPDGRQVVAANAGTGLVAPTLLGSDGNVYQLAVSSHPSSPEVDDAVVLRVRVVNAETGERLPKGVDFNLPQPVLDGEVIPAMPERVDVALINPDGSSGYRIAPLYRVTRSTYEGEFTFPYAGSWQTDIRLQIPGSRRVESPGGVIEVDSAP